MKKRNIFYLGALMLASLTSCEDFLDRDPLDKQTNDTYWQTESSLRTYAQDFYSSFYTGYATDYTDFGNYFSGDDFTDDFLTLAGGYYYFPKANNTDYNNVTGTWSSGYDVVYKANVMIEKIPGMNITEEAKNHWMGIARYFRAMGYSSMVKVYGGVPYMEGVTDPADVETLYKDRDSYQFVAEKILEDFQFALDNVRTDDTKRQVNKYVVGAYMSREMLYHATWLKYHGSNIGSGSQAVSADVIKKMLQGAINGAEVVMKSGKFAIGNTYTALFATDDLWNNPEIIWYREYTSGLTMSALISYNASEDQTMGSITQNAVESYLCSDGLPIGQSPLYQGTTDPSIENSFLNRDPRLYQTVADSLRIMGAVGMNYTAGGSPTGYPTKKFLNDEWFAQDLAYCKNRQSPADAPCIRYAEVLLNYAEAMYEAGNFSQAVLDASINQLRKRQLTKWGDTEAKTMPTMTYASGALSVNGTVINDPARDPEVDPVLWEIRRERRVELMMEGRRGEDLRRWAKYEYLNSEDANGNPSKTILGAYMNVNDYPASAKLPAGERGYTLFDYDDPSNKTPDKGYIMYNYAEGMRVFQKGDLNSERYYLRAIPVSQITAYSDKGFTLTQNPGW